MSGGAAGAPAAPFRLEVHAGEGATLAEDALRGLTSRPKSIPPRHLYDARGSELFEEITRLDEYYQTRAELGILRRQASAIVARHGVGEVVELGSGSARKTATLLEAVRAGGDPGRYIPFDVSPEVVRGAAARLAELYPGLEVHGIAGDFGRHLPAIPPPGRRARMVAFLGGTIGNLAPDERGPFLREVAGLLGPAGVLVVGTDLAGDPARIVPAYDDARGVTAAFNLNLLGVLNRELGADFDPGAFEHVVVYDEGLRRVEMRLRSRRAQRVRLASLGVEARFDEGEEMLTEISCKFTRGSVEDMYAAAGLRLAEWHPEPRGRYAVSVAVAA